MTTKLPGLDQGYPRVYCQDSREAQATAARINQAVWRWCGPQGRPVGEAVYQRDDAGRWVVTATIPAKELADLITRDHRTLQQMSFKLVASCIERWAKAEAERNFDARNEATVKKCRAIMELDPDLGAVPYI